MRPLCNASLFIIWVAAIVGGFCVAFREAWSPASTNDAAPLWPQCRELEHEKGRPTLAMFVHPHCPCTRASLDELTSILTRCRDEFACKVVFVRPDGVEPGWEQSDSFETAKALPGVEVLIDSTGQIATAFGARTSGECFLCDARGQLLFHGGITASRGHVGDNVGENAVLACIQHGAAERAESEVYGCELFDR